MISTGQETKATLNTRPPCWGDHRGAVGDHLGSTSYLTDVNGLASQYIDYLPFGEVLLEEQTRNWMTPYKFNCKELDEESGLYYYGARYYDPRSSVWLGVDPMSDKYPSSSPFVYCANNPVIITDPDGMDWFKDTDGSVQFDPKINKDSKLGKGQSYLGETYNANTKRGTAEYRKDGSSYFSNSTDGINSLDFNAKKKGVEELGVLTKDGGMLVTPDYLNTETECNPNVYGYEWKGGNLLDKEGNKTNVEATIHTHYATGVNSPPSGVSGWGKGDLQTFARYTPGKAVMTMGRDGFVYGLMGKYTSSGLQWGYLDKSGKITNSQLLKGYNIRSLYINSQLKSK